VFTGTKPTLKEWKRVRVRVEAIHNIGTKPTLKEWKPSYSGCP